MCASGPTVSTPAPAVTPNRYHLVASCVALSLERAPSSSIKEAFGGPAGKTNSTEKPHSTEKTRITGPTTSGPEPPGSPRRQPVRASVLLTRQGGGHRIYIA